MQNLPPAEIYKFASGVLDHAASADALYLPCPQWQAAQIVETIEQACGKPAIAYTHANFFVAFKTLGITEPIHGHGRLLASLAEAT
jgi:maleate cis-trans isomerase